MLGGFAEIAVAPDYLTFALPEALDFAQGAALILNYHTAYFALKLRGRLAEGERVLVHGAAGGVARPLCRSPRDWARARWLSSRATRRRRSRATAGADEVVRSDGSWRDAGQGATGGGVDVVLDPVGGDRFTDSLRSLREDGRWWSSASPAARSPR